MLTQQPHTTAFGRFFYAYQKRFTSGTSIKGTMNKAKLGLHDFQTPTWKTLDAVLHDRIAQLQKQLEREQPENSTALLRGRIREIRRLLDLPKSSDMSNDAE